MLMVLFVVLSFIVITIAGVPVVIGALAQTLRGSSAAQTFLRCACRWSERWIYGVYRFKKTWSDGMSRYGEVDRTPGRDFQTLHTLKQQAQ